MTNDELRDQLEAARRDGYQGATNDAAWGRGEPAAAAFRWAGRLFEAHPSIYYVNPDVMRALADEAVPDA